MTRYVAIIQARMGSSRLPGKVLLPLGNNTVLSFMVERVKAARKLSDIVIATTVKPDDDPVFKACQQMGIHVYRGDENDVLKRFADAAVAHQADVIIRLTGDCPLADPLLIDEAIERFESSEYDYFSNVVERSYPDGLDIEIFTIKALQRADKECKNPWHREHVTTYLRTGAALPHPAGKFRVGHFHADADFQHLRWTLDTPEDYEFITALADNNAQHMLWKDILSLLTKRPDLLMWNRGIKKRTISTKDLQNSHHGYTNSTNHLSRALKTIPVGSQTFSKSYLGWVLGEAPLYAKSGKGAIITDIDENCYIDYMMALLPVVLGYADPYVDAAVVRQIEQGVSLSMPGELETVLAEKLIELIPCAEMVRFGKNGSDATSAAIRLARAYTGREKVVVCGYHGWHDWYIGTTTKNLGVPQAVRDLSLAVPFNDPNAFEDLLKKQGDEIAAFIIEPTGKLVPEEGYLKQIKQLCENYGVILIFDEVISGFRINLGGAQAEYNVTPDLSAFGKAMANGYPLSALVGRRDIMSKMETIFFSATFGGELSSIAASLATIEKLQKSNAIERIQLFGKHMTAALNERLVATDLNEFMHFSGEPWWPRLSLSNLPVDQSIVSALLRQEFTNQGLLIASGLNFCLAHDEKAIEEKTLLQAANAFEKLSLALHDARPDRFLKGSVAVSDFDVRGHMGKQK